MGTTQSVVKTPSIGKKYSIKLVQSPIEDIKFDINDHLYNVCIYNSIQEGLFLQKYSNVILKYYSKYSKYKPEILMLIRLISYENEIFNNTEYCNILKDYKNIISKNKDFEQVLNSILKK